MDSEENSSASFILEHLLKILSVIENGEKRQRWKLFMNSDSYTLIVKFLAKDNKAKGQGIQQSPLKTRASGVVASQHKDNEQCSSDVRLPEGGGGTLIFCEYIGEAPASTPKPKKLLRFADHPKKNTSPTRHTKKEKKNT